MHMHFNKTLKIIFFVIDINAFDVAKVCTWFLFFVYYYKYGGLTTPFIRQIL